MSLRLGLSQLGLGGGSGGGGLSPTSQLPLGTLLTVIGDGVMSETAAGGPKNTITRVLAEMSGRVLPSEAHNLCRSGDSFAGITTRMPYATGQIGTAPHIFVLTSFGHNPESGNSLMATDPAGAPGIALMDAWEAVVDLALSSIPAGNYTRIILSTTIGSEVAGESTYAASVNTLQLAYLNAKAALDPRITVWDAWAIYNHSTASSYSHDSGASYTHPDDRGARAMAFGDGTHPGLYDIINALVVAAAEDDVYTYLAALGTNFDADFALSGGTGGTRSGTIAPTGSWPTGKRCTNNLTNGSGISVVCSIADMGTHKRGQAIIGGIPAATNTLVMDDTASITATGSTPGRYFAPVIQIQFTDGSGGAPVGLQSWSINWGNFGLLSSTSDVSSSITDGVGRILDDNIIVGNPNPTYGSSANHAANPAFTMRFTQTALAVRVRYQRPMIVEFYTTARAQPCPIWKASGEGANYVQRLTGTFSNGNSLRAETGRWSGGGFSDSAFVTRKIFMTDTNGAPDNVAGAGTEMASLSGSTWTWTASGLTGGKYLWLDITVNNGVGAAVTERAGPYTIV